MKKEQNPLTNLSNESFTNVTVCFLRCRQIGHRHDQDPFFFKAMPKIVVNASLSMGGFEEESIGVAKAQDGEVAFPWTWKDLFL